MSGYSVRGFKVRKAGITIVRGPLLAAQHKREIFNRSIKINCLLQELLVGGVGAQVWGAFLTIVETQLYRKLNKREKQFRKQSSAIMPEGS